MKILRLSILALLIGCCFSSCKDDDGDGGNNCSTQGSFSVKINGTTFTAASFNNTLVISTSAGVDGKRGDIRAIAADGSQLILTFTDLTTGKIGDCVDANADYIPVDDVQTGEENTFFFTMYDANYNAIALGDGGTLDITSCDASNHTLSGKFTFTGQDNNGDDWKGTNGTFTNVCYTLARI